MALLQSEMDRLRYELGYNLLTPGSQPYIQFTYVFDQVVRPYLSKGAITQSSTQVIASIPQEPTLVTLTLADSTGFSQQDTIYVDIGAFQEETQVRSIVGLTIDVILSKSHPGTYPITVDGGEGMVRQILKKLKDLNGADGIYHQSLEYSGIKKVDEVEFYGNGGISGEKSRLQELKDSIMRYRDELSSIVGIRNLWRDRMTRSCSVEMY